MAWTRRTVTFGALASATSRTVNKPTGTVDGDIVLIAAYREDNTDDLTSGPSGGGTFTEIASEVVNTANTPDIRLRVWWTIAASEPASYTVTWSTAEFSELIAIAYTESTGAFPASPIDVTNTGTGNSATPGTTSVNTTVANTMKVLFSVNFDGDAYTNGATGMTERGDGSACGLHDEEQASAGASGAEACAIGGAQWAARLIAIKPGVAGGDVTVSPSASTAVAGNANPTVVLGSLTVAPAVSTAVGVSVNPTVVNNVTLTPSASTAVAASVDPTVVLGSITLTPSAATAVADIANPTVTGGGDVAVTPSASTAVAVSVNPTVVLGSLSLTPAVVTAVAGRGNPDVVQGSLTLAPSAVTAVANRANPTIVLGSVAVTPSASTAVATSVAPTLVFGSTTATPSATTAVAGVAGPTVVVAAPGQAVSGTLVTPALMSNGGARAIVMSNGGATPASRRIG